MESWTNHTFLAIFRWEFDTGYITHYSKDYRSNDIKIIEIRSHFEKLFNLDVTTSEFEKIPSTLKQSVWIFWNLNPILIILWLFNSTLPFEYYVIQTWNEHQISCYSLKTTAPRAKTTLFPKLFKKFFVYSKNRHSLQKIVFSLFWLYNFKESQLYAQLYPRIQTVNVVI